MPQYEQNDKRSGAFSDLNRKVQDIAYMRDLDGLFKSSQTGKTIALVESKHWSGPQTLKQDQYQWLVSECEERFHPISAFLFVYETAPRHCGHEWTKHIHLRIPKEQFRNERLIERDVNKRGSAVISDFRDWKKDTEGGFAGLAPEWTDDDLETVELVVDHTTKCMLRARMYGLNAIAEECMAMLGIKPEKHGLWPVIRFGNMADEDALRTYRDFWSHLSRERVLDTARIRVR